MTVPLTAALIQLCVGDDPAANLPVTLEFVHEAADKGATLILTPEGTNILSPDRAHQTRVLRREGDDLTLRALREAARDRGVWIAVGSLSLATGDADGRFANRSFLIGPDGEIAARYDKIHMFDVEISESESFRESAAFCPGGRAVTAAGPWPMGLTICYDLRFPHLYRALAHAGARLLTVPAAFHPVTGAAHWETLLRARAIETGAYVLAPAQCGTHPCPATPEAKPRQSHGHSLAVDPWGAVIADGGSAPGVTLVTLDPASVDKARSRIPSLSHDRPFDGPDPLP